MPAIIGWMLWLTLASAWAGDRQYESEEFGFRAEKPDDTWAWSASAREGDIQFSWTLFPGGTKGVPSFVVYVKKPEKGATSRSLCEAAAIKLAAAGGSELQFGTTHLHGLETPNIRCRMASEEFGAYALSYAYVVAGPYVYALQRAEPISDEATHRALDSIEASFEVFAPKPVETAPDDAKLRALAARCGSEIEWCTTWKSAAERAAREDKIVLAVYQNYRALALPETLGSGPFMDPDLVALVNEGFVALHMEVETEAPFRDPKAFGLSPSSFGVSFLFVDASGHVLCETSVEDAAYLHEFARGVLRDHPRAKPPAPPKDEDKLDAARRALRRGDLEAAEKVLSGQDSSDAHELRAALARMKRKGKEALTELRAAREHADDASKARLDVARAVILMRLARYDEASAIFTSAAQAEPTTPAGCEAMFWLGAFDVLTVGVEEGTSWWKRLVDEHPDDRWAWKAAANLLSEGQFILGSERLDWPSAALVASVARLPIERLDDGQRERTEREAVQFLAKTQLGNGSWICPADAFGIERSLYTPAIVALCGASLVPFVSQKDAGVALGKALAWSLDAQAKQKLEGTGVAGVYSIWSRTCTLMFFTRCLRAHIGDADAIGKALDEIVSSVEQSRHVRGGWPYIYLPGDPKGTGLDPSASFLTAGVVLALLEARDAGAKVSAEVLADAVKFLERIRAEDGSFGYFPDLPKSPVDGEYPEAAGRGPLCALALFRGGKGSVEEVRARLKTFDKFRASFVREWHKELCHTSPEGFGCHYLFYDYVFACAALRVLPGREGAPMADALAHEIVGARFADGSFEDMPSLGRAYGTAMALMALRELRPK